MESKNYEETKSRQSFIQVGLSFSQIFFTGIIWLGDRLRCINDFWCNKTCHHAITVRLRLFMAVRTYPVLFDSNNSDFRVPPVTDTRRSLTQ
jgi:hypothetical protein